MSQRAILFDLDGTLVDSVFDLAAAANALLAELGRPGLSLDAIAGMVGDGVEKLVERVLAANGAGDRPLAPAVARFRAFYDADPTRLTRPYPGVPEALVALTGAGYRLAVCTNKHETATRAILARLGLARHFDAVIGGDTLPAKKPDPAPLLAALGALGAAPAASFMVGDHRNDVLAAQGAHIAAIFARYGYGLATLKGLEPAAMLDRIADLPRLVADLRRTDERRP